MSPSELLALYLGGAIASTGLTLALTLEAPAVPVTGRAFAILFSAIFWPIAIGMFIASVSAAAGDR